MMNSVAQKIADKLRAEKIIPISERRVSAERIVYWLAVATLTLLAGLMMSFVFLFFIQLFGPRDFFIPGHPPFMRFLLLFPYIWILFTIILFTAIVFVVKKTPHGYRYQISFIILLLIGGVSIFATLFHLSRIDERAERVILGKAPQVYTTFLEKRWNHPDDGVLAGEVVKIRGKDFDIQPPQGDVWKILTDENTIFVDEESVVEGDRARIIGTRQERGVFLAKKVKLIDRGARNQKEFIGR